MGPLNENEMNAVPFNNAEPAQKLLATASRGRHDGKPDHPEQMQLQDHLQVHHHNQVMVDQVETD